MHACCRKPANANELIAAGANGTGQLHIHAWTLASQSRLSVAHVLMGGPGRLAQQCGHR